MTPYADRAFPAQPSMGLWIAFRAPFVKLAASCLLGCLSVGDLPRQMAHWGLVTGHYWPGGHDQPSLRTLMVDASGQQQRVEHWTSVRLSGAALPAVAPHSPARSPPPPHPSFPPPTRSRSCFTLILTGTSRVVMKLDGLFCVSFLSAPEKPSATHG